MKKYIIKKVDSPMSITDERWNLVLAGELDQVWQDYYPSPYKTEFRLVHSDEGLTVKLSTTEWPLRVTCVSRNQEVCEDSCMEFFLTPNTNDADYFNIEITAIGISLVGIGPGRSPRKKLNIAGSGIEIQTLIHPEEGWELMFTLPYSYMKKFFGDIDTTMRANFYKIGNATARKHYSIWNKQELEMPDFHRPEFFGELQLSDELI